MASIVCHKHNLCLCHAVESCCTVSWSSTDLGSRLRGGVRGGRTCTSAHADTRMLDATKSHGITSYTLWGSWHVKRAIPAQMHQSLTTLRNACNEFVQSLCGRSAQSSCI